MRDERLTEKEIANLRELHRTLEKEVLILEAAEENFNIKMRAFRENSPTDNLLLNYLSEVTCSRPQEKLDQIERLLKFCEIEEKEDLKPLIKEAISWFGISQPKDCAIDHFGFSKSGNFQWGIKSISCHVGVHEKPDAPVLIFSRHHLYISGGNSRAYGFSEKEISEINSEVQKHCAISHSWNGLGRESYSIIIDAPVHKSLKKAFDNDRKGCQLHPKQGSWCNCASFKEMANKAMKPGLGWY